MPLYLTEQDVAALVTIDDAIDSLTVAFVDWYNPNTSNRPRQRVPLSPGALSVMAGSDGASGFFGLKAYFSRPNGAAYHVALYSLEAGQLVALIEANLLSQLRTGAASGLATKLLARPDATTLALIGTGKQARAQLLAVAATRPIDKVLVFSSDRGRREAFAAAMRDEIDAEILAVDAAREAVENADVVTTITKSAEPVVKGAWLQAGTHLNLAGANAPDRREGDDAAVLRAAVRVTDDCVQARIEAGEFIQLAETGQLAWGDVCDLGAIASGRADGRKHADDITLFKSLGIALEDVAFAGLIYNKALETGRGRQF